VSAPQTLNSLSSVDWNVVAGAIATFIVTVWVAYTGRQSAKKKELEQAEQMMKPQAVLAGATLQDNVTLMHQAESIRSLIDELKLNRNTQERLITHTQELQIEIERLTRAVSR